MLGLVRGGGGGENGPSKRGGKAPGTVKFLPLPIGGPPRLSVRQ